MLCTQSPNIIRLIKSRRMRWALHVLRMAARRGAYRILVGRYEGRRPLGKPRRKQQGNIKMLSSRSGMGHGLESSGSGQG
jgi:hypothetical protein